MSDKFTWEFSSSNNPSFSMPGPAESEKAITEFEQALLSGILNHPSFTVNLDQKSQYLIIDWVQKYPV